VVGFYAAVTTAKDFAEVVSAFEDAVGGVFHYCCEVAEWTVDQSWDFRLASAL